MSEPVDILAIASARKNETAQWVSSVMLMNASPVSAANLDRAFAELKIAQGDYDAAETLMMALRA